MSIVDDAYKRATAGFDFKKSLDRLRGAYVRRRGTHLHATHGSWSTTVLTTALQKELEILAQYIKSKDALIDNTENKPLSHTLLMVAAVFIADKIAPGTETATGLYKEFRANRVSWISQIVWRAASVHPALWKDVGSMPSLHQDALDEILDRRLHAVEQMHYIVNSSGWAGLPPNRFGWKVDGPNGPWTDGFMRTFEYPQLPKKPFDPFLEQMSEWKVSGGVLVYDPSTHVPTHVMSQLHQAWKVRVSQGGTGWIVYQPSQSRKPADVMVLMCEKPYADFLDRSWLFCDMVGSLIQIDALWLANRRRHGNDDAFDAAMNRPDYVSLGPVIQFDGQHDLDVLMSDDQDPFFENLDLDVDELQVGDFVCVWNGRIYNLISDGAWRNEFSYVMGIDVDGSTGKVRVLTDGPQIWLAGHGMDTKIYNAVCDDLATILVGELASKLYPLILGTIGSPSPPSEITIASGQKLVSWSPYERFDEPGAWWLEIPRAVWKDDWTFSSVEKVLKAVPRTVTKEVGGSGYNAPPSEDAVYFPLNEPDIKHTSDEGDSWRAYLNRRKEDTAFRAPATLKLMTVDGRVALGLFYRGANTKFPVVRPRVRT